MRAWIERRDDLELISAFACRYHARRHSFLDRMAKTEPVLSLVFGSTSFASAVAGRPEVAAVAALIVAVFSAMNLSFGFASCAAKHEVLMRRWSTIRAKALHLAHEDEEGLRALEVEAECINGESPDQLRLLSAICEDEERIARGLDTWCRPVPCCWKALANLFSLDFHRFQKST